jgi:hypothetical protein
MRIIVVSLTALLYLGPAACIADELLKGPYPQTLSRLAFTVGDCQTQPEIEDHLKSATTLEELYRPLYDIQFHLKAYGPDINLSQKEQKDAPIGAALYVDLTYQLTELEAILIEAKLARAFPKNSMEHTAFLNRVVVFYRRTHNWRIETYVADSRLESPTLKWGIRACKLYREKALGSLRKLHASASAAEQEGGGQLASHPESK